MVWSHRLSAWVISILLLAGVGSGLIADEDLDSIMYRMPEMPTPPMIEILHPKAKDRLIWALQQPGIEHPCRAAHAICRGKRMGYSDLESSIPYLAQILEQADRPRPVQLAICKALVVLGARDQAQLLLRVARQGLSDVQEIVEPALADWKFAPAGEVWRQRLTDSGTPARSRILAMRGLAAIQDSKAVEPLRALILDRRLDGAQRIEAARALGSIRSDGLEDLAKSLMGEQGTGKPSAVIAAAELLRNHQGDKAVSLLLELGKQSEAAAAAPAGARLLALGEKLAWPLYPQLRNHPDPVLRAQAVELLYRMPQGENLTQLADFLADEHPDVRQKARKSLLELATKRGLKKEILIQGERLLATDGWRAQEQAGILLTDLDHKPITPRLLALLSSKRPEVFVMASWGLRKLAVKDTLPPILKIVEKEVVTLRAGRRPGDVLDDVLLLTDYKLAHLIQFLGMERYEPALPILRKLIPQQGMTEIRISETRAAGIWALGMIYDGKLQKDLVPQLEGRIRAISSFPPEDPRVCGMSAITLGRMNASEALPTLKQYYTAGQYSQDIINNSCGWAVTKITGGPAPKVTPFRRQDLSLFLNALE